MSLSTAHMLHVSISLGCHNGTADIEEVEGGCGKAGEECQHAAVSAQAHAGTPHNARCLQINAGFRGL